VSYGDAGEAGQTGVMSSGASDAIGPAPEGSLRPAPADVLRLLRRGVQAFVRAARAEPNSSVSMLLRAHLGPGAASWPVVADEWAEYDHINVQAALDVWLAEPDRKWSLFGLTNFQHMMLSIGDLVVEQRHFEHQVGSVAMVDLPAGPDGEVRTCVRCGLWLFEEAGERWAMLLWLSEQGPGGPRVRLEILRADAARASATIAQLRRLALEHNVYRGHVVGFGEEMFGPHAAGLSFLRRPQLAERDLVLADGVLGLVERQVLGIARQRKRLRASGQHLKRGVLLHGPPGTGKTQTVRYLLGRLEGVTVVVLSGRALYAIKEACSVARALAPAAIVVEDVDLIAEDRGPTPGTHPLLFQLLNEMDGLGEDVDVAFILTTNRADLLEPALAARPGRVDQAVHIALPDADGRRRLLELYRGKLDVRADLDPVLQRTEGVTASFLKELMRRSALSAAEEVADGANDAPLAIEDRHLKAALDELLDDRHQLTRSIIGGVVPGAQWDAARAPGGQGAVGMHFTPSPGPPGPWSPA
jgi:hypothetical protein